MDGLGTSTAPAGAAAAPQALHLPYGNGATDHELEKIPFGEESIVIDGPPVPRSPDHAAAAAGYKVCYHPSLRLYYARSTSFTRCSPTCRPLAPLPLVPVTNQSLDRREMTATAGKGGTASFCQSAGRRLLRIRASAKKGLGSRRARWGWGCRASAPTWAAPASPRPIPSRPARRRRRRGGRSRPASTCSSCSPRNRLEAPRAFARTNAPSASRSAPQLKPLLPASGPSCSR